jgi:hypothetical protein
MISLYVGETYPDTSIIQTEPRLWTVQSNDSFDDVSEWGTWKERFSKIEKLSVFIFHTDTLNKYTWEEVRDGYMILKRYDMSLDDLKQCNFTVTYPPNEIMKNVKMHPPYGNK